MEGAKIKNIVIVILLLLNIFLLFLVAGRRVEDIQSCETARLRAIQIIQDSGVALDETIVPREMDLTTRQASRDQEREGELAAALLGGAVTAQARGGEVYRYYNGAGFVQFHSTGEFAAEFEQGQTPLGQSTAAAHAAEVLATLGFDGDVVEDTVVHGTGTVTVRQRVEQTPVLSCQAAVNYADGQMVSITNARRVFGQPEKVEAEESLTVATALMRLYNGLREMGDIYNAIETITPAYTMSVSLSGPARLTPVWYVRTDTGAYQLDTQTGQLSRVSGFGGAPLAEAAAENPAVATDE